MFSIVSLSEPSALFRLPVKPNRLSATFWSASVVSPRSPQSNAEKTSSPPGAVSEPMPPGTGANSIGEAQSLPVAHGDAETAVGGRRQRIEREFGGVGQNAVCRVAVGDERRRDGTPEREREVTFVGDPFLLPDQRLPDFVGPFRVSPRKTGESDRIPASGFRREAVGEQGPARRGVGRQLRRDAEKVVFGVAEGDLVCSFRTVGDGADDDDAPCVEEVGRPRFYGAFEYFIVEAVARLIGPAVRTVQVRAVAEPCSHVVLNVGDVRRTHSQLRVRSRKEDREFRQIVGQEVLPPNTTVWSGFTLNSCACAGRHAPAAASMISSMRPVLVIVRGRISGSVFRSPAG